MNPVLILGTPRSGTSVVAGIVHHLGVDLGQFYLKPDTQNATGYFEDAQILEIDYKYYEKDREMWRASLKKYLGKKDKSYIWGWKNPTLSITAQEVKGILRELLLEPKFIYCRRNLKDIEKSQQKHFATKDVCGKIKEHERLINSALKDEEVLELHYEEVVGDPGSVTKKIIDFLELKPSKHEKTRAILSVIQPPVEVGKRILAIPSRLYI